MTTFSIDTSSIADYRKFLAVRKCPVYEFSGHSAIVPDEYANFVSGGKRRRSKDAEPEPAPFLFDYQRDITRMAIRKRKFAVFVEPGYGKTLIMTEFARHAAAQIGPDRPVLLVSPLMVVPQTISEAERFYPGIEIQQVRAAGLQSFLETGRGLGITNYEVRHKE